MTSQAPPVTRRIPARPSASVHTPGFTRLLVLGAAVAGVAEIVLARVVAPILSHVPSSGTGSDVAGAVIAGGDAAIGATLVLVVATALALAAGGAAPRVVRPLLAASLVAVLVHVAVPTALVAAASYLTIGTAAAAAAVVARRVGGRLFGLGVATLALAYLAGMAPIALGAAASGTLVRTAAEAAVLTSAAVFAAHVLVQGVTVRAAWWVAGAAGLGAAGSLAADPGNSAAVSLWATGVTLGLPPVAYVIAATCFGLVLAQWSATPDRRHLAAGLVLVAVAGIGPGLVHHNLTAVLGLAVLAAPTTTTRAGDGADTTPVPAGPRPPGPDTT